MLYPSMYFRRHWEQTLCILYWPFDFWRQKEESLLVFFKMLILLTFQQYNSNTYSPYRFLKSLGQTTSECRLLRDTRSEDKLSCFSRGCPEVENCWFLKSWLPRCTEILFSLLQTLRCFSGKQWREWDFLRSERRRRQSRNPHLPRPHPSREGHFRRSTVSNWSNLSVKWRLSVQDVRPKQRAGRGECLEQ